ncbi:MAG: aminotransferase class IV [Deltaproteobacteria bacterium]|uniref:aminotransferase class IV n=1 Tax=Desulfobacula sp. TaxID=2593537 RepID=UPI00199B6428|nr:aminotransferase class IV [Candidatus Desulfobacula maris]MBL6993290.1 aminotransferase class IV [Desulfobacula sp.]
MPELAYLNGVIRPINETYVPIEDRGYQFGDAVYEFIASYNGKLFCLQEHLDRLEKSMEGLSFPKVDRKFIQNAIDELFEKAGMARAGLYIQISRGVAPRDHAWAKDIKLQIIMTIKNVIELDSKIRDQGIDIITVQDERWSNCDIKTVQILFNAMAKQKAKDQGAFDAIFISKDGIVREGTSSNFFLVKDGGLITHPLTKNILPGITRMVVMDLARNLGIKAEEKFLSKTDLFSAEEAFLTGTVTEILGIKTIDGVPIGKGKPGEITQKLYRALREKAE